MEEEQHEQAPPVEREKKVTLQSLEEVDLFQKWTINLRILLEPISILRYVVILLCMLAFSLTTGFNPSTNSNSATCTGSLSGINISNATVSVGYSYPYIPSSYSFVYQPTTLGTSDDCSMVTESRQLFSGSAEFFVFMSVIMFIYGIIIVPFYVFFYTKKLDIYKYAAVVDLIVTILVVFFFLLSCIAWSAGNDDLRGYVRMLLMTRSQDCLDCVDDPTISTTSHAQVSISLLFGWCACFVLLATLWFIYKDTLFHLERMGPLYRLSFYKMRRGGGEAEDQTKETSPDD